MGSVYRCDGPDDWLSVDPVRRRYPAITARHYSRGTASLPLVSPVRLILLPAHIFATAVSGMRMAPELFRACRGGRRSVERAGPRRVWALIQMRFCARCWGCMRLRLPHCGRPARSSDDRPEFAAASGNQDIHSPGNARVREPARAWTKE